MKGEIRRRPDLKTILTTLLVLMVLLLDLFVFWKKRFWNLFCDNNKFSLG